MRNDSDGRILLIEDNDSCSDIFGLVVKHLGYEIVRAHNGLDGLQKAVDDQPALIVMDLMMPVMDGIEATRLIKRNRASSHIPIIVLTAALDSDLRHAAADAGAAQVLLKPIDIASLRSVLHKYLPLGGATQS